MQYTKAIRKRMRELVGIAYERELSLELTKLEEQFKRWKIGEVDAFELSHLIHQYHNGPARVLYNRYTDVSPEMILPYALKNNLVLENECPGEIIEEMKADIKRWETIWDNDDGVEFEE